MSPCISTWTESRSLVLYCLFSTLFRKDARSSTSSGLPPVVQPSPWVNVRSGALTLSTYSTSPLTTAASIALSNASTSVAAFVEAADSGPKVIFEGAGRDVVWLNAEHANTTMRRTRQQNCLYIWREFYHACPIAASHQPAAGAVAIARVEERLLINCGDGRRNQTDPLSDDNCGRQYCL